MKTTEQKNRMIAEFMGVNKNNNGTYELPQFGRLNLGGEFKTEFNDTQMRYHTSWDWLMPVVKECFSKIEIFEYDSDMYEHCIECIFHPDFTLNAFMNGEINDIHERVVEFIEWYNKNK